MLFLKIEKKSAYIKINNGHITPLVIKILIFFMKLATIGFSTHRAQSVRTVYAKTEYLISRVVPSIFSEQVTVIIVCYLGREFQ